MDQMTLLIIAAGVGVLVLAVVLVAWRSRSESVLQVPTTAYPIGLIESAAYTPAELADMAATGKLIEMTEPLVLQSMEQALKRGGPMTRYVVRYQGKLWITFEPLPDAYEREQAYEQFRRWHTGEDVDMRTLVSIISKIGK